MNCGKTLNNGAVADRQGERLEKEVGMKRLEAMLDPKADATQGFKEEWLVYWPAKHTDHMNLYIVVDPAAKKKPTSDYTFM
ncbi:hypothetical protein LCGC14_1645300, partial [marine sediment metagenome]